MPQPTAPLCAPVDGSMYIDIDIKIYNFKPAGIWCQDHEREITASLSLFFQSSVIWKTKELAYEIVTLLSVCTCVCVCLRACVVRDSDTDSLSLPMLNFINK